VTATGTSRGRSATIAVAGVAATAIALAACGGGGTPPKTTTTAAVTTAASTPTVSTQHPTGNGVAHRNQAFAWLRPSPRPAGWRVVTIPNGATLPYPQSWHQIRTDTGTATVALQTHDGQYLGYLNITPRQSTETTGNWTHFRIDHNHEEGDRVVTALSAAKGLHFRTGKGACLRDAYKTATSNHYIELACLVVGHRATTVIVGAAPPGSWSKISPLLEQSISSMTT
jgi:hypothetical protein